MIRYRFEECDIRGWSWSFLSFQQDFAAYTRCYDHFRSLSDSKLSF
jgi:hypothetical protein